MTAMLCCVYLHKSPSHHKCMSYLQWDFNFLQKWDNKNKSRFPAKQAGNQWPDQKGRKNKGTEEAIFHSQPAAPHIFHMAMQI